MDTGPHWTTLQCTGPHWSTLCHIALPTLLYWTALYTVSSTMVSPHSVTSMFYGQPTLLNPHIIMNFCHFYCGPHCTLHFNTLYDTKLICTVGCSIPHPTLIPSGSRQIGLDQFGLGQLGPEQLGPGPNCPLFGGGQLGPGAQLSWAQLSGAQLSGAQLSEVQLSGIQLSNCIWANQILDLCIAKKVFEPIED